MALFSRTALYADDPTFLWKAILRSFAILLALVGIGTTAWAISNPSLTTNSNYSSTPDDYDYGLQDFITLPWTFITLGLSIIWNITNLAVLSIRKRAIHPGANVACDLVLWLALSTTGAFAVIGAANYIGFYPYYGSIDAYGNDSAATGQDQDSNGCDGFTSCAAQSAYEHAWQHKGIVIIVAATMTFIAV